MRLWHYTNEQSFQAILNSKPNPGRIAIELERADGNYTAIFFISLQQLNKSKPDGLDTHFGDGLYATDIRPGSMRMKDICAILWNARAARSQKFLERVKYHFQFEVGNLFIPCRAHVFKIDTDNMKHWRDIKIVKHGRTKELTEFGSQHT